MKKAQAECENSGEISLETRNEIRSDPRLLLFWISSEYTVDLTLKQKEREVANRIPEARNISVSAARKLLREDPQSLPEYKRFRSQELLRTVRERELHDWSESRAVEIRSDYGLQMIPDAYHLDKIIRYGNWVERDLDRAYDRLEQMQRRRKLRSVQISVPGGEGLSSEQ